VKGSGLTFDRCLGIDRRVSPPYQTSPRAGQKVEKGQEAKLVTVEVTSALSLVAVDWALVVDLALVTTTHPGLGEL